MVVTQKEHYVVDLSALQAIYERNYTSLMRLLPAMRETGYSRCIAFTADQKIATRLTFTVLENSPYTSYILLKQDSLLGWMVAPQLYIRCYHDVQLAEITFAQNTRSFRGVYAYPNKAMHQPDEKRQLNQFLEEWLIRCLSSGYEVANIELNK
ncbi:DUF1249 domain-containing protein [Entomomonas sp. E2T0]|uniref:DUF1249 domain-containing protein n=1 Tax=Entomomonas sp. E2T0 TaxID=2930213 RepID=UPI0022283776|nr:DUF1249 domain-containing protein [Entomomonas sp. E2T0]UYZ84828.1 DUF1249 domain-containing protein [Entomomonas sp. E2T0]